MPRPRNNELTSAALLRFCAQHPNVPQGTKGYHLAKSEDARAHEQCVPPLAAFYDPLTIAHEVLARLRELQTDGEEPVAPVPPIGRMRRRNRGGARFVVTTLFSIATDPKAPPAARLSAVDRIETLVREALAAIYPPIQELVGGDRGSENDDTVYRNPRRSGHPTPLQMAQGG